MSSFISPKAASNFRANIADGARDALHLMAARGAIDEVHLELLALLHDDLLVQVLG